MNQTYNNVDQDELDKFEKLAGRWWYPHSEFKPLHEINPLRLDYINRHAPLHGKHVIDVHSSSSRTIQPRGFTLRLVMYCGRGLRPEYGSPN